MSEKISLKELERSVFKTSIQNGVLDIQIGSYLILFISALFLSRYLGDFWSSAVLLPFWVIIYLGAKWLRKKIIHPRVGRIEYGSFRKKKMTRLTVVILVINIVALILGFLSFFQFADLSGWVINLRFSITLLLGFSLAGYMLEFPLLYLYGVLVATAPLIGEYLYQNHGFSHHGYPVTFGSFGSLMIIIGIVRMARICKQYPLSSGKLSE